MNGSDNVWGAAIARPLRLRGPGAVHHVIARGNERKAVFRDDRDREEYLNRLARYRERFGFSLYAYCLMTNHLHLAIEEGEVSLSRIMHGLQSSYAQWFNRRRQRVGHLFQGRFKSFLVDRDAYLLALLRYIHENPVRAGIVEKPQAYRWSSDRFFRRGRGPSWLDLDRALAMLGPTRSAALSRYRRVTGERSDSSYEKLPAIEGMVKGGEPFVRRALADLPRAALPPFGWTAERVARSVAALYGLTVAELGAPGQRRSVSTPRIVAAYLGRSRFRIPVARFARLFRREESSLLRGVLCLERRLSADPALRGRLEALERDVCENTGLHA